jgi:hypothetical protein
MTPKTTGLVVLATGRAMPGKEADLERALREVAARPEFMILEPL